MQLVQRHPRQLAAAYPVHRRPIAGAPRVRKKRPVGANALLASQPPELANDAAAPIDDRAEHVEQERLGSMLHAPDQHSTPAVLSSDITASAASVLVSALSAFAMAAKSVSSRWRVTMSSYRLSAARARLSTVASSWRNSGTTNCPASTFGSPTYGSRSLRATIRAVSGFTR